MAVNAKDRKPYTHWLLKFIEQEGKKQPTKEQLAQKQLELLQIYAKAVAGVVIVEDTSADEVLRKEIVKARAAMKET